MDNDPVNDAETRRLMLEQMTERAKKQFLKPPISDDDEGDLAFMIAADPEANAVRIRFAKPVVWIDFEPEAARHFANIILEKIAILEVKPESAPEPATSLMKSIESSTLQRT